MEGELSELARLFFGHESVLPIKAIPDGSKKERFLFLLQNNPDEPKSFYKNALYDGEYSGTGYEVLRNELSSILLTGLYRMEAGVIDSNSDERVILVNQVCGIRQGLANGHIDKTKMFGLTKTLIKKAEKLGLRLEQGYLIRNCIQLSGILGDKVSLENFKKKLKLLTDLQLIEDDLYVAQAEWTEVLRNKGHMSPERVRYFETELDRIADRLSLNVYSSPKTEYLLLRLGLFLADIKKDFVALIGYAEKAFSYSGKVPSSTIGQSMSVYLAYANANLGRLQEFLKWEKEANSLLKGNQLSRSVLIEVSFAFRMNCGEFDLAFEKWTSFFQDKEFKMLSKDKEDAWQLFGLYLKLAVDTKIWKPKQSIDLDESTEFLELKSGPLKTNKVGTNISLIVLDFCESLLNDQFGKLLDIEDSLARYISRNLKTLNERPKVFLGMLLKVIKLDFNPFEIEKRTRKQLEKLRTMAPNFNMDMGGNEIIRYEVLWEWILKKLKESSLLPKPKA